MIYTIEMGNKFEKRLKEHAEMEIEIFLNYYT